jgi:hypothetical protein
MGVKKKETAYQGFEQGPIRPPSEANSLLIRVTRNCPWNRCSFCPVYKGARFSLRPVEHVLRDIDTVAGYVSLLQHEQQQNGDFQRRALRRVAESIDPLDSQAFQAALHWVHGGSRSIFLQDANSLIIRPSDLIAILEHLRRRFPWVQRITSYARSHTVARISDPNLKTMCLAGLNRIHIGMESGADVVLKFIHKGVTQAVHIEAGLKIKAAGMELSEYIMPGLGGQEHSETHALESARALNQINPDFIRLRTLAIPSSVELWTQYAAGSFKKCTDLMMARETLLFIETLDGITSTLRSDHILNLFEELQGTFPEDKHTMLAVVRTFLELPADEQMLYQVGRRMGVFQHLADMHSPRRRSRVERTCREMGISPQNVDQLVDEIMQRFI